MRQTENNDKIEFFLTRKAAEFPKLDLLNENEKIDNLNRFV